MSKFLNDFVVGIDVSSEFSVVAMLEPNGSLIRKPFRIDHNPAGFNKLLGILKGFVLNPLCVHSIKNFDLRKVKNDAKDTESIARLAKFQDVNIAGSRTGFASSLWKAL